jgi:hypothetical protein
MLINFIYLLYPEPFSSEAILFCFDIWIWVVAESDTTWEKLNSQDSKHKKEQEDNQDDIKQCRDSF